MALTSSLSLLLTAFVAVVLVLTARLYIQRQNNGTEKTTREQVTAAVDPYSDIKPLSDFDWKKTSPHRIWPFKPKYHMTMALENISMDNLIEIDDTYLDRINLRRQIMKDHRGETLQARPGSEAMVEEFYTWMFGIYLPARFPTMYTLIPSGSTSEKAPTHLHNLVTKEDMPLIPSSPLSALEILSAHVDTDFLFLSVNPETSKYHLEAFATCFPSGFSTLEKLGQPLAAIHTPVPGYTQKLEKSMDRFFANLPVGKIVKRGNWSITTNDQLFSVAGNHMYVDGETKQSDFHDPATKGMNEKTLDVNSETLEADIARQKDNVVIEECRLRCERQTLIRLPKTRGILFAFKTYQYKLSEVKEAGAGPELADAADGLGAGTVPGMKVYKRQLVWGDKVAAYLRSPR